MIRTGALVPVQILPPQQIQDLAVRLGQPALVATSGHALIDTGADISCVARPVLQALQIPAFDHVMMRTPAGRSREALFSVQLTFPTLEFVLNPVAMQSVDLDTADDESGTRVIALLGRNLLSYFTLTWNGPDGAWSIST